MCNFSFDGMYGNNLQKILSKKLKIIKIWQRPVINYEFTIMKASILRAKHQENIKSFIVNKQ